MQEADDLEVVANDLVEDQMVRELSRGPGPSTLGTRRAELPLAIHVRILGEHADGVSDCIQELLGGLEGVRANKEVGLLEILHGHGASDHADLFSGPCAAW